MDPMTLILFAQPGKAPPPPDVAAAAGAAGAMLLIPVCAGLLGAAIGLSMLIWYLVTMYKLLNAISPKNRDMEPGMLFLIFIPLLNIVWPWLIMFRTCSSLQKEYDDRGMSGDGDYGKTKGLVHLVGSIVCPPVGFVGLILYVLQMRKYLAELGGGGSSGGGKKKRIADDDDDE